MRMALLGDVMLGRLVGEAVPRRAPESFWGDVLPLLRGADLVVANLECAVTTHARPWTRTPKVFHFRAPPEAVNVLRAAGVRLVSLANNHVLDFEERGLADTLLHLDAAGIVHAGAGVDLEAAESPALVEAGGVRVGVVAATDNEPDWEAGPGKPGTSWLPVVADEAILDRVGRRAAEARGRGADLVVLSLHWGPNMVVRPPEEFRRFARGVLERGVDLVHGHSSHVFQGVEVHRGKPVLYDTGDFLDDYAVDPVLRNDLSLLFLAEVEGGAVRELRMVPVRLELAVVNRARGDDLEDVVARMKALCAELGTRPEWDPEVGALVLRPGDDAGRRPASHRPALRDTSSS